MGVDFTSLSVNLHSNEGKLPAKAWMLWNAIYECL